jgi:hypothetical protein
MKRVRAKPVRLVAVVAVVVDAAMAVGAAATVADAGMAADGAANNNLNLYPKSGRCGDRFLLSRHSCEIFNFATAVMPVLFEVSLQFNHL